MLSFSHMFSIKGNRKGPTWTNCLLYNLLYEFQSGFRKSGLVNLTDRIGKEVDVEKYYSVIMLDLRKAFNTVNHDILLIKQRALGFNNSSLQWVTSGGGREQVVNVNGTMSIPQSLKCWVLHGSISGLFFPAICLQHEVSMFLQSVPLRRWFSAPSLSSCYIRRRKITELELHKVSIWLAESMLSLHLSKIEL